VWPPVTAWTGAVNAGRGIMGSAGRLRIQYYRSAIGFTERQKLIVKGLGFKKLHATREVQDTPAIRGMLAKVPHLVRILEG
jgi:large subunit ribosomal protein L30